MDSRPLIGVLIIFLMWLPSFIFLLYLIHHDHGSGTGFDRCAPVPRRKCPIHGERKKGEE